MWTYPFSDWPAGLRGLVSDWLMNTANLSLLAELPARKLNFTVLYALEPASFLRWLLHTCEDTPALIELHVIVTHDCEVCLYWCRVTQGVTHKVWSNEKRIAKTSIRHVERVFNEIFSAGALHFAWRPTQEATLKTLLTIELSISMSSVNKIFNPNTDIAIPWEMLLFGADTPTIHNWLHLVPREATVAERITSSPPTKANRVQSPAGSPDLRKWESCQTMPLVGVFSPTHLHSGAPSYSLQSPSSALKPSLLRATQISSLLDQIDFKRVYTEVTFSIGLEFIRHALDDSAPIAGLQGNKKRIPYCQMWGNTGVTANVQTSEVRLYEGRFGRLLTSGSRDPLRVIEVSMEQVWNEKAQETGDPRENPPANVTVRHDSRLRKSGVTRPGIGTRIALEGVQPRAVQSEKAWCHTYAAANGETMPARARLYGRMYKYADIYGTSVVCCHSGWRKLDTVFRVVSNTEWTIVEWSGEISVALNINVLRANDGETSSAGMQGRGKREIPEKPTEQRYRPVRFTHEKIDFIRIYTEVTLAIGSEPIRHALDDSAPIADLQGNKKRIPYCQMWGNTGATVNEQTSEQPEVWSEPTTQCGNGGRVTTKAISSMLLRWFTIAFCGMDEMKRDENAVTPEYTGLGNWRFQRKLADHRYDSHLPKSGNDRPGY
ncbi:hypothetical protein PR048_012108 [Dryococelus australis]|uniref:Uncharacterized protein n=1 Tax=Dryococelus australis TaxID=614101 RepID=A0ABQ9HNI6_9NEOP|nr:hypothetical protein PR048_012108 [Dryococelus australis]